MRSSHTSVQNCTIPTTKAVSYTMIRISGSSGRPTGWSSYSPRRTKNGRSLRSFHDTEEDRHRSSYGGSRPASCIYRSAPQPQAVLLPACENTAHRDPASQDRRRIHRLCDIPLSSYAHPPLSISASELKQVTVFIRFTTNLWL